MKSLKIVGSIALILSLAACAGGIGEAMNTEASAELTPTKGNQARGYVHFIYQEGAVVINAEVSGLKPGAHGFHIHEHGDCSAPDGTSAGGHFNPTQKKHGHPDAASRHLGDMPQLIADATGKARLKTRLLGLTIGSGNTDIVGRSLIVHADPDDFTTQPTGNSGARVACGVITLPKTR